MAGALDLATLQDVRAWLGIDGTAADPILRRLISGVSGQVLSCIQRSNIRYQLWSEIRDGTGTDGMLLRNWPVLDVAGVSIGGGAIPAGVTTDETGFTNGWLLSEYSGTPPGVNQQITLRGWMFDLGVRNVRISYTAGYVVRDEATIVPASGSGYVAQAPLGPWAQSVSVVDADTGAVWTQVSSAPTASGQYWCPSDPTPDYPDNGTYVFFADDEGTPVLITYSYTPSALEHIVVEEVSERFRYKDRIGARSKVLGGQETVSFDLSGLPAYVARMLIPWTSVVPVPL